MLRTPRYPQIHYYDLFFSVRVSDQTYCAEYTTPVLDEINDLFASSGKDIEVTLKKSKLIARTSKRYKIKAHLVSAQQCLTPKHKHAGGIASAHVSAARSAKRAHLRSTDRNSAQPTSDDSGIAHLTEIVHDGRH